eukprot:6186498-Pleurochrysis_carterae.AAC.2
MRSALLFSHLSTSLGSLNAALASAFAKQCPSCVSFLLTQRPSFRLHVNAAFVSPHLLCVAVNNVVIEARVSGRLVQYACRQRSAWRSMYRMQKRCVATFIVARLLIRIILDS